MKTDIQEANQNSAEPVKEFAPSKGMIKWVETTCELGHTASVTDIAQAAGMDRSNFYLWRYIPGFAEWYDSQMRQYYQSNRWKLLSMGMKQAERNHDYWHDMMAATGQIQEGSSLPDEGLVMWRKNK